MVEKIEAHAEIEAHPKGYVDEKIEAQCLYFEKYDTKKIVCGVALEL